MDGCRWTGATAGRAATRRVPRSLLVQAHSGGTRPDDARACSVRGARRPATHGEDTDVADHGSSRDGGRRRRRRDQGGQPVVVGRRGRRLLRRARRLPRRQRVLVWGPEGWTEAELDLLGVRDGMTGARDRRRRGPVLALAGPAPRRARGRQRPVDAGCCAPHAGSRGRAVPATRRPRVAPRSSADATARAAARRRLVRPRVFTAYGVVPFVADSGAVLAEAARVLRPGGRFVFSTSHPVRWAFPDDPGPNGLTATSSYFDRTPYVESEAGTVTYAEHHRTLGDLVRAVAARAGASTSSSRSGRRATSRPGAAGRRPRPDPAGHRDLGVRAGVTRPDRPSGSSVRSNSPADGGAATSITGV